jgi:hypothetical protein
LLLDPVHALRRTGHPPTRDTMIYRRRLRLTKADLQLGREAANGGFGTAGPANNTIGAVGDQPNDPNPRKAHLPLHKSQKLYEVVIKIDFLFVQTPFESCSKFKMKGLLVG